MAEKILSIFIDESGDFGAYESHCPYYLVSMVMHDQRIEIKDNLICLDEHLQRLGYPNHAIHTGPLIRREAVYANDTVGNRKKLFNSLFHFTRQLNFRYICVSVRKSECRDEIDMASHLSRAISEELRRNKEYLESFDKVIIYYDNGQIELTKILTSIFNSLFFNVEFRKVQPVNYRLFQVADLICTLELLSIKERNHLLTKSEEMFFGSVKELKKSYLKLLQKKKA